MTLRLLAEDPESARLTPLQSWQQLLGVLIERAGTELSLEEREALWTFVRTKADHELLPA